MMKRIYQLFLISLSFSALISANAATLQQQHIEPKIKPFFDVYLDGQQPQPVVATDLSPEEYYDKYCVLCHKAGVSGAPIVGNAAQWKPRIAQGIATLVKHANNGYKAMPPKGTCMACSDEDIKKIVEFMVDKSK